MPTDDLEFHLKYRPNLWKEVIGQEEAVETLSKFVKTKRVPHAVLFTGEPGCGKTSMARILRRKLKCHDNDYREVNAASSRGIEMVRGIQDTIRAVPRAGKSKVWHIDEAHRLTPDAQDAILKTLEEPPRHAYIILSTTVPQKLVGTIISRCTEIRVKEVDPDVIVEHLKRITSLEGFDVASEEVFDKIAEVADGSVRKALVLLHQIAAVDLEKQLDTVEKSDTKKQAIELARALIQPKPKWSQVKGIVKAVLELDEPEKLRRMVIGYASSVCIGGGKLAARAMTLFEAFQYPFFDTGKPGFVFACYAVCSGS
jgi:DNA polymerase III gamma/tau subunit